MLNKEHRVVAVRGASLLTQFKRLSGGCLFFTTKKKSTRRFIHQTKAHRLKANWPFSFLVPNRMTSACTQPRLALGRGALWCSRRTANHRWARRYISILSDELPDSTFDHHYVIDAPTTRPSF